MPGGGQDGMGHHPGGGKGGGGGGGHNRNGWSPHASPAVSSPRPRRCRRERAGYAPGDRTVTPASTLSEASRLVLLRRAQGGRLGIVLCGAPRVRGVRRAVRLLLHFAVPMSRRTSSWVALLFVDNGEDGIAAAVVAGCVCFTCLANLSIDLLTWLCCCSVVVL